MFTLTVNILSYMFRHMRPSTASCIHTHINVETIGFTLVSEGLVPTPSRFDFFELKSYWCVLVPWLVGRSPKLKRIDCGTNWKGLTPTTQRTHDGNYVASVVLKKRLEFKPSWLLSSSYLLLNWASWWIAPPEFVRRAHPLPPLLPEPQLPHSRDEFLFLEEKKII